MDDTSNQTSIIDRLRSGEKIACEKCGEGYYVTEAKDPSISHFFHCNKCSNHINVDDADAIVE